MSEPSSRQRVDAPSALPVGARLGEFELLQVLGVGGFGIVYLAFDHALEREVAVKEYMPASLAGRTETMHVSLRSQSDAETFALGLKSFVNEARLLARFDHPSLLKVHRFWEGNGTAYMAMPVMRGRNVKEVRADMQQPPDEAWVRALLDPLLGAIEKLHSEGVYHRDIAPDNIQIEPDGHPVLLDFGAARRVISDKSQALTAILKPAYAPIEQYAEVGSVRQGPWTDIYALGATLHYLLLGRPPPPATARAVHDDMAALSRQRLPGCSEHFLATIDWMLAPRPGDRPQSVAQLRAALDGQPLPAAHAPAQPAAGMEDTLLLPSGSMDITIDGPDAPTVVVPPPDRARPQAPSVPQGLMASASSPTVRPAPAAPAASAAPRTPPPLSAPPVAGSLAGKARPAARSSLMPLVMGVGVLAAVGVAVAVFWPRQAANPSLNAATAPVNAEPSALPNPAAGLASAALPTPAPAAMAVPVVTPPPAESAASVPSALPAAAESAVATVIVPPSKPAVEQARSKPVPPPASSPVATTKPPAVAQRPAPIPAPQVTAMQPEAPRPRPAPPSITTPANHGAAGTASKEAAGGAAAASNTAPAAAQPQPAPVADAAQQGASPEARCGGRNPIMYFVCMERQCLRSEFADHADCKRWRKDAKRD
ncbi:MAG: protein kinase [Rubrivivax sp.]|nr:protein kinase [Rubrivivax sp.]